MSDARFCRQCGAQQTDVAAPSFGITGAGDRRPPVESPQALLLATGERARTVIDDPWFTRRVARQIEVSGPTLLAELAPDDRPTFWIPVDIEIGKSWEAGSILTLADRAVFCWWIGNVRPKVFCAVIPYEEILDIGAIAVRRASWRHPAAGWRPEIVTLLIQTDDTDIRIRLPSFGEMLDLPSILIQTVGAGGISSNASR